MCCTFFFVYHFCFRSLMTLYHNAMSSTFIQETYKYRIKSILSSEWLPICSAVNCHLCIWLAVLLFTRQCFNNDLMCWSLTDHYSHCNILNSSKDFHDIMQVKKKSGIYLKYFFKKTKTNKTKTQTKTQNNKTPETKNPTP